MFRHANIILDFHSFERFPCIIVQASRCGAFVQIATGNKGAFKKVSSSESKIRLVLDDTTGRGFYGRVVRIRRDAVQGRYVYHVAIRFEDFISVAQLGAIRSRCPGPDPRHQMLERLPAEPSALLQELQVIWGQGSALSWPLKNIIYRMYRNGEGATQVVLQYDYLDSDHFADYLSLYNEVFRESAFCNRLYFYGTNADSTESFLGAVVLRPFFLQKGTRVQGQVGRSLLSPLALLKPCRDNPLFLLGTQHKVFALQKFRTVATVAYQQQDTLGARCAHVALKSVADYLHKILDTPKLSLEDIRHITNPGTKHVFPQRGLSDSEFLRVLASLGGVPLAYKYSKGGGRRQECARHLEHTSVDFASFVELMHIHIDSQLPVLLTLRRPSGRHAVVVVGHDVDVSSRGERSRLLLSYTATSHIRDFIVNDDTVGPYVRLPVTSGGQYPGEGNKDFHERNQHEALWEESLEESADGFFVCLPEGVRLAAEDVVKRLRRSFSGIFEVYKDQYKVWRPGYRGKMHECLVGAHASGNDEVTFNVYLDLANRFKSNLFRSEIRGEPESAILYEVPMPRFVWIVEISTQKLLDEDGKVLGFIVIDATASPDSAEPYLAARLPGVLFVADERLGWFSHKGSLKAIRQLVRWNFERDGVYFPGTEQEKEPL